MPRVIASVVLSAVPDGPELPIPSPELPVTVLLQLQQEPGQIFRMPADAGALDREFVYAAVQSRRPLYITVEGDRVVDVTTSTIGRLTQIGDASADPVSISLDATPRGLRIAAGNPGLGVLQTAGDRVVMLNVDGRGNILDAQLAPPDAEHLAPVFDQLGLQPREEIVLPALEIGRVHDAFEMLLAARCGVENWRTCLPFDYPDMGCEARAHDMCIRMARSGIASAKIWIFPPMSVFTRNSQLGCYLDWSFHVAPLVSTTATDYVLDPALFDRPMPIYDYVAGMNADLANVGYSTSQVYQVGLNGRGSPARRDDVSEMLRECRKKSKRNPPPPYDCPPN